MPWEPQVEYLAGLQGVYRDSAAHDRLTDLITSQGQSPNGDDTCRNYGLVGSGEGKLSMPFAVIEKVFPGSLPASAQSRGDCVSHSTRNAILGSLACEIAAGKPDDIDGDIEGVPQISETARKDGVLSTEAIYWWRGHGGDGWSCDHAAEVAMKQSGMWLRKDYPEVGVNLTRYSGQTAGKWGRTSPPRKVAAIGREHLVRTATRARGFAEVRDLIANGYCISSCGGESFGSRDRNGVSNRTRGGWSHAMSYLAVDDREEAHKAYGGPLVYLQNSWGPRWNGSDNRRVMGTDVDIPLGGFWARWKDVQNRYAIAFSSLDGWPPQRFDRWFTKGVF